MGRLTNRLLQVGVCSLVLMAVFPALAFAGGALKPPASNAHEAAEAGRWALVISLMFLVIGLPLVFWGLRGLWWLLKGKGKGGQLPALWWGRSLLVGKDNRVSTSKTTALVWTYTLAGALLSFVVARWLGHPEGYEVLIQQSSIGQYAVLIGGPLGAAILAKGIVSSQIDNGTTAKPAADEASPAQLVQDDTGETDLGDLQYLLFNFVALVFFYGEMFRAPQAGLPSLPEVLVGLTSVAAVGFVGKKALMGPPSVSEVRPMAARVGASVKIATAGVIKSERDKPLLSVTFGAARADERDLHVTTTPTAGSLIDVRVPPDAAGAVDLEVSLPAGKKARWSGFKVIPEIESSGGISGGPGEIVRVSTKGVNGLGRGLPGLKVRIADQPAKVTSDADNDIRLEIPAHAQPGPHKIVLETPGGRDTADIRITG